MARHNKDIFGMEAVEIAERAPVLAEYALAIKEAYERRDGEPDPVKWVRAEIESIRPLAKQLGKDSQDILSDAKTIARYLELAERDTPGRLEEATAAAERAQEASDEALAAVHRANDVLAEKRNLVSEAEQDIRRIMDESEEMKRLIHGGKSFVPHVLPDNPNNLDLLDALIPRVTLSEEELAAEEALELESTDDH